MTTRIYRVRPGRWVAVTRHPSGGVVRETYTSGRAALIALDGRNRERRAAIELTFTYELASSPGRRERARIVLAPAYAPPGRIPRDTAPNGPHDYQGWVPAGSCSRTPKTT